MVKLKDETHYRLKNLKAHLDHASYDMTINNLMDEYWKNNGLLPAKPIREEENK